VTEGRSTVGLTGATTTGDEEDAVGTLDEEDEEGGNTIGTADEAASQTQPRTKRRR
jgi:hypothetical protein